MALVHCRECGEMISESAPTCPKCGASQGIRSASVYTTTDTDLDPSVGLNIVSFLWPLVGLILYFVYYDKSPRRAKECGKWALIGCIVQVIAAVAVITVYVGALAALISIL